MARSSPYASISGRNRAIQDAWRANLAIKAPFSRRGPGNHTWCEDVANAARPFAPGVRARRPANCPNGLCALRPGPGPLAACAGLCHLVRAAPQRCRYSRGRIHRRRPTCRARRAHYAASPATPPVTSPIAVGGGPPIGRPRAAPTRLPSRHPSPSFAPAPPLLAPGLRRGSRNSREMVR